MNHNNKKHYLNEDQYIQIKEINKMSYAILKEFVIGVYNLIPEAGKYFNNPYKVIGKLDEISFVGKYYCQATDFILDVFDNEKMPKYYYEDAWDSIIKVVYHKRLIIKQISKKMIKSLYSTGQKEVCKIRTKTYKKLEKLQDELNDILKDHELG